MYSTSMDNAELRIKDGLPFAKDFVLQGRTLNSSYANIYFHLQVCGEETITVVDPTPLEYNFTLGKEEQHEMN